MIVDTHVHVVAPDTQRYPFSPATGFRASGLGPWHMETPVSAEQMLEQTAAARVDRVIVVQPFSAYGFDNSYHADSATRYPERLTAVCTVDPLAADAPDQLTYWIRERGMTGLRLTTSQEGSRLDDPRSFSLWQRVSELGVPVCVLTTPQHWGEVEAMASRFPGVRIALDHAGGMGAGQTETVVQQLLDLAALLNLYLKVSTVNFAPLKALGNAGIERWEAVVRRYGPRRMMWGSNYPVSQEGSYADMVELGRRALPFLAEDDRNWLLAGTALSLWPQLEAAR